ncbi:Putative regulatory protein, TetR family [Mycobacteroides abscessus subsp. bolletii]|uniref:TetR family transcriptional regulator n=2 Tax=Mycobacteroides abscessus TaxID=36809 RepID=A0A9Q7WJJ1_9MYCO|nr:TetR family transcriptional regulator [Mycobacteroides abscessus subsp. bolletii]SHU83904.1 TetR family transcriptional regulator [Mycobacteroides abscessus subsp. bolletii]SHX60349.1 TetR family transcriptional regulator [Mycobacteroides abscessus subsp. bolletii]SHX63460.1 Putative regulatory protein, TetR family [Mycobacteroides abscessus subsp. bolletii]SKM20572.1 TetR family transcriptional regulator [Mycobacteroides abscessus subsp. bolletii]
MRAAGQATYDRIMAAAKAEFTEHGLAGARLNRIAINANASKERLYSYFESKERLFEAVVAQWISDAPYQVPLSAEDVPGYVAGLFDNIVADPQGARLQRWIELEAPDGMFDNHLLRRIFQAKLDEVRRGQQCGLIDPAWDPKSLLMLLIDIAYSMAASRFSIDRIVGEPLSERTLADRRNAAAEAARRLVGVS